MDLDSVYEEQKVSTGTVLFTYDVIWRPSQIHWASRWDIYLSMNNAVPAKVVERKDAFSPKTSQSKTKRAFWTNTPLPPLSLFSWLDSLRRVLRCTGSPSSTPS